NRRGDSSAGARRIGEWESRSALVPPSQTRCFGRSNTGLITGCGCCLSVHTSRTPAAPLCPTLLPDSQLNKGGEERTRPAAAPREGQ
ncbi:hypothetical protein CHARACLAT_008989, partial [Characodon lateralis]|nr:hypothetical protein [Characodon lateralis]